MRNSAKIRTTIATLAAAFVVGVAVAPGAQAQTVATGPAPAASGTLNPGGTTTDARNDGRYGRSPEAMAADAHCAQLSDWATFWAQRAQEAKDNGDQQGYEYDLKMYAYNVNLFNQSCRA
jgi:hypothetical protein